MWDRFISTLRAEIEALEERRAVRLINARHFGRVKAMLTEHNGTCVPPLPDAGDEASLRLPVTAVLEPQPDAPILLDEVFGPCWAVLRVPSIDAAIDIANHSPTGKPLVSYYYGQSGGGADAWLQGTSSGSLAINAGAMRMQSNFNAAVHGVGNSGLGGASICGEHVFNTFSHAKHIVRPRDGALAGSIWGAGAYKPA